MIENIATFIMIYGVTFWVSIFLFLPLRFEADDKPVLGQADSAPKYPHLGFKMLLNALFSLILSSIIFYYTTGFIHELESTYWQF